MEKYAKNVRMLKTPFPACILYKDIVCVIGTPDATIPILDTHGIKTIKDVSVFTHEDYPDERVAIFRVKKSELDNWLSAFQYMEKHPPTEHYNETCDKLDQLFTDFVEEMKK